MDGSVFRFDAHVFCNQWLLVEKEEVLGGNQTQCAAFFEALSHCDRVHQWSGAGAPGASAQPG